MLGGHSSFAPAKHGRRRGRSGLVSESAECEGWRGSSTLVRESGRDGVCETKRVFFECKKVRVVPQPWACVQGYVCGQAPYDGVRGLAAASRRAGKGVGTFGGENRHADIAQ